MLNFLGFLSDSMHITQQNVSLKVEIQGYPLHFVTRLNDVEKPPIIVLP